MNATDPRTTRLHGPPHASALHLGDRAVCLFRDAEVIVTSWTGAPILWPRCRAIGCRGGSGLLVDDELSRAVYTEFAAAVCYCFGVGTKAVWHWRRALDVTRTSNSTTHTLVGSAFGRPRQRGNKGEDARAGEVRTPSGILVSGSNSWTVGENGPGERGRQWACPGSCALRKSR